MTPRQSRSRQRARSGQRAASTNRSPRRLSQGSRASSRRSSGNRTPRGSRMRTNSVPAGGARRRPATVMINAQEVYNGITEATNRLTDFTVRSFDGSGDIDEWIRQYEDLAEARRWSEATRKEQLPSFFTGSAGQWLSTRRVIRPHDTPREYQSSSLSHRTWAELTWSEVKRVLIDHYLPENYTESLETRLKEKQRPGEDLIAFFDRKVYLGMRLRLSSGTIVQRIKKTLLPDYRKILAVTDIHDLDEFLEKLKEIRRVLDETRELPRRDDRRREEGVRRDPEPRPRREIEPRPRPRTNIRDNRALTCYNCGRIGHVSTECRSPRYLNDQRRNFNPPRMIYQPAHDEMNGYQPRNDRPRYPPRDPGRYRDYQPQGAYNERNAAPVAPPPVRPMITDGQDSQTNYNNRPPQDYRPTQDARNQPSYNRFNPRAAPGGAQRVNVMDETGFTHENEYMIPLTVNNRAVKGQLDTGAGICCLDYNYFRKNWPETDLLAAEGFSIKGCGGSANMAGRARLEIKYLDKDGNEQIVNLIAAVVYDLGVGLLVGRDFMNIVSPTINVAENKISCGAPVIKPNIEKTFVYGKETVEVPARTTMVLNVEVEQVVNYHHGVYHGDVTGPLPQTGMISNSDEASTKLSVANSLVDLGEANLLIPVTNFTNDVHVIEIGDVVAQVENCEYSADDLEDERESTLIFKEETRPAQLIRGEVHIGKHLTKEQENQLVDTLSQYDSLFSFNGEVGECDVMEHDIDTGDAKPIHSAPYRQSPIVREKVQKQIDEWLEAGVIRPSRSPWASPIVLVPKKDNTMRMCIDLRGVNKLTKKDVYPLPNLEDTLSSLNGAVFFSSLDLNQGYMQIRMARESIAKTAFISHNGLYEFVRMPFGLTNAPATFQRCMNLILSGLTYNQCLVYLDDIIIFGDTFENHNRNLVNVLQRIKEAKMTIKPSKCAFAVEELRFLGHIVGGKGVRMDPEKISTILESPQPETVRDIQSFIGSASYYRRFIKDFSKIAEPMTQLTKKEQPFVWGDEQQASFDEIKKRMTTQPVLCHFDPKLPMELRTDACGYGLGAILLHEYPDKTKRVISYASRLMLKSERNYCISEQECLAVVWAVNKFKHYLQGAHFKVVTDHIALTWLQNKRELTGRLMRWSLILQMYDCEIIYKSGKHHKDADHLSRNPVGQTKNNEANRVMNIQIFNNENDETGNVPDEPLATEQNEYGEDWDEYAIIKPGVPLHRENFNERGEPLPLDPTRRRRQRKFIGPLLPSNLVEKRSRGRPRYLTAPTLAEAKRRWNNPYREPNRDQVPKEPYWMRGAAGWQADESQETLSANENQTPDGHQARPEVPVEPEPSPLNELNDEDLADLVTSNEGSESENESEELRAQELIETMATPTDSRSRQTTAVTNQEFIEAQQRDEFCNQILNNWNPEGNYDFENGILVEMNIFTVSPRRIVVPKELFERVMYQVHDDPVAAHGGYRKTLWRFNQRYYIPQAATKVKKYVQTCQLCQARKGAWTNKWGMLQSIEPATRPFQRIGIDTVGPLKKTKDGYEKIIVITDYMTKWAIAKPVMKEKAEIVTEILINEVFLKYGSPEVIVSDRGPNYNSKIVKQLYREFSSKHIASTPYHPQTNGLTERFNKTLGIMISMYVNEQHKDWEQWLPYVVFAYNTVVQDSTGYSPFYLLHGFEARMSSDVIEPNFNLDFAERIEKLQRMRELAIMANQRAQTSQKKYYDHGRRLQTFEVGDLVMIQYDVNTVNRTKKFQRPWVGPFKVIQKNSDLVYVVSLDVPAKKLRAHKRWRQFELVHITRMKKYHARENETVRPDADPEPVDPEPSAEEAEDLPAENVQWNDLEQLAQPFTRSEIELVYTPYRPAKVSMGFKSAVMLITIVMTIFESVTGRVVWRPTHHRIHRGNQDVVALVHYMLPCGNGTSDYQRYGKEAANVGERFNVWCEQYTKEIVEEGLKSFCADEGTVSPPGLSFQLKQLFRSIDARKRSNETSVDRPKKRRRKQVKTTTIIPETDDPETTIAPKRRKRFILELAAAVIAVVVVAVGGYYAYTQISGSSEQAKIAEVANQNLENAKIMANDVEQVKIRVEEAFRQINYTLGIVQNVTSLVRDLQMEGNIYNQAVVATIVSRYQILRDSFKEIAGAWAKKIFHPKLFDVFKLPTNNCTSSECPLDLHTPVSCQFNAQKQDIKLKYSRQIVRADVEIVEADPFTYYYAQEKLVSAVGGDPIPMRRSTNFSSYGKLDSGDELWKKNPETINVCKLEYKGPTHLAVTRTGCLKRIHPETPKETDFPILMEDCQNPKDLVKPEMYVKTCSVMKTDEFDTKSVQLKYESGKLLLYCPYQFYQVGLESLRACPLGDVIEITAQANLTIWRHESRGKSTPILEYSYSKTETGSQTRFDVPTGIKLVVPNMDKRIDAMIADSRENITKLVNESEKQRSGLKYKFAKYIQSNGWSLLKKIFVGTILLSILLAAVAITYLVTKRSRLSKPTTVTYKPKSIIKSQSTTPDSSVYESDRSSEYSEPDTGEPMVQFYATPTKSIKQY